MPKPKNPEDLIQHTVSVRYRVYGTGVLRTTLFSLQDVNSSILPPITMTAVADRFPTIIANFRNMRTQLEFKTTGFGETFVIAKVIAFTKLTSTGYPTNG